MVQILDVGCGDRPKGTVNLDLYKDRTAHLEGYRGRIEPTRTPNFVNGTIYQLPFPDNGFDVVLCHHTLEHLKHPEKAVKELLRVSRDKVEIVVPFGAHEIVQSWFLPFRKRWMKKYHLWQFTKKLLRSLFNPFNGELQIKYRYRIMAVARNPRDYRLGLKQKLLYGLVDVLPPIPSEIVVTARVSR